MSILFRRARVVDGTGAPAYLADVRVDGDRISRVAPALDGDADDVVDAAGHVLAPGFIDMHAHSDLALVADRAHDAKVTQGVTTEVIGQDGLGYAPLSDAILPDVRTQIAGWNGHPELPIPWRTVAEYLDVLGRGTATNVAVLVPQGNLRLLTVGQTDRPATAGEIDRMCGLLADGMAAGAVGMSSGLTYTPGMFADTAELTRLCRVVAAHGGFYAPHTRSYGRGALDAYAEVIAIARDSGCALHLTHATLNFASNADSAPAFLGMIEAALADGIDITLDTYPYLPGATTLVALLPSALAAGGPHVLRERLASGRHRTALRDAFEVTGCDGFHGERADWSAIEISGVADPALAPCVGRTIADIAQAEDEEPTDTVVRILLADDFGTGVLMHVGHEHNVRAVMRHRTHCGGSDGILVGARPHPRAWGTFPRYLGHYVRDCGVLTLEECVHHLTGNAARRLGLADRGTVRENSYADLVLFDPDGIEDRATFAEPRRSAAGIAAVMINGRFALRDGVRTAAVAGRVLSSSGKDPSR
ncbi:N-acyl-D-amino-acid deacylase family protein [Microbacterium sp.]|uniref:N-acyl-D-amino-acid deacylase family protein n=1 Tax=Microbacterium sp. TaxID=51671 RepID=UPI003A8545C6